VRGADISVVLPAHGRAPFLRAAIGSILAEGCLELLVIDDRLGSEERALLSAIDDARLRVVPCAGVGLVAALNTGMAEARGELIARMDADDVSLPLRLGLQQQQLESHPELVAIGGQLRVIDETDRTVGVRRYPTDAHRVRRMLQQRNALAHPAAMYRRDAARRAGGYRSGFPGAEDYDLWLRMLELGDISNLDADVLAYRVHAGQITSQASATVAESTYLAQWSARERKHGRPGTDLPWEAGAPEAPTSLRMRVVRWRIRTAARMYSKARAATALRQWPTAVACGAAWAILRPRYSLGLALSLPRWLAVATGVRPTHE